jgi:hypothetical protein
MDIKQLQIIIFDYFKDTDDATLVEIVDVFVYDQPNPTSEVSKIIEKFLKDNGLNEAFLNAQYDKTEKASIFSRSSLSQVNMIENVKMSLLGLSFNRFRVAATTDTYKKEIEVLDDKIKKQDVKVKNLTSTANAKTFDVVKRGLLECYSTLNNNDQYFFGETEDAKFVKLVNKLELL